MIETIPKMTKVQVVRHGVLRLAFDDGVEGEVDVLDHLWGQIFARARTPEGFAEARLDEELGTVAWPGDIDLAPDTLHYRLRTGEWPGDLAELAALAKAGKWPPAPSATPETR